MLPTGSPAQAAGIGGIPPLALDAPATAIAAFDSPRNYWILPPGTALTVPLRGGPGEGDVEVARLGLHDAVIGHGTSNAPGGSDWVWVTRSSDGLSGYVHKSGLLDRSDAGRADAQPILPAGPVVARTSIDARYRALRASASGLDRIYLTDGQRLWEAQRLRCDDGPRPDACRAKLDAQRMADLDDWRAAGESVKR